MGLGLMVTGSIYDVGFMHFFTSLTLFLLHCVHLCATDYAPGQKDVRSMSMLALRRKFSAVLQMGLHQVHVHCIALSMPMCIDALMQYRTFEMQTLCVALKEFSACQLQS